MNLIRYSYPRTTLMSAGRSPWRGLESEFDRLFETAIGEMTAPTLEHRFPVDLYEDKDNTYVRAELPGLARDDINLELVDGYLTITGERKTSRENGSPTESLSLNRSIAVPADTQADKITAQFENGVLTVTLPKREEAKPKKLTIEIK